MLEVKLKGSDLAPEYIELFDLRIGKIPSSKCIFNTQEIGKSHT